MTPAPGGYESSPDQLATALAETRARLLEERQRRAAPFAERLVAWIEATQRRRELYARHHPRPLPIDGHEYRRRRRHR